jgi:hypothetical protein
MPMSTSPLWSLEYLMGRWQPTIGDPSFIGWFTVGAYFVSALLSFFSAWTYQTKDRRSFFFWNLVSLLMLLLAINKQLDLQSLFTEIGRQIAQHQGWMEQRRSVQFWFIVGFSTMSTAGFIWFALILQNLFRRFMLAFVGLFFLLSFIIIRAASFHHFDEFLIFSILDFRMNWILELTGIFIIAAAAAKELLLGLLQGAKAGFSSD